MTKSRSVALVLRSLGSGGVEAHACQLATGLVNRGFKVFIISLCEGEVNHNFRKLGVPITQLADSKGQSLNSLRNVFVLRKTFLQLRPDIVHLHGIRPIFIGSIAARLARTPRVISTMHGSYKLMTMDKYGHSSRFKLAVSILMHSVGILLSNHFITVAKTLEAEAQYCLKKAVGNWLAKRCYPKISVVKNGIGDRFFNGPSSIKPKTVTPTIGTIARLDPKKGISFLIEAVRDLNMSDAACRLLVIGDGPSFSEYKNFVLNENLEAKVNFVGHQECVIPFIQKMDIFVLPSLSEGMPLVILEAMAMGTPVIATAVGGIPEIVENNITGLLIPAASTEALADALRRLLTDPKLRLALSQSAYQHVDANHRETHMIDQVVAIYGKDSRRN
jgi:glycosyltransferase involved in cell wall biosynthesis